LAFFVADLAFFAAGLAFFVVDVAFFAAGLAFFAAGLAFFVVDLAFFVVDLAFFVVGLAFFVVDLAFFAAGLDFPVAFDAAFAFAFGEIVHLPGCGTCRVRGSADPSPPIYRREGVLGTRASGKPLDSGRFTAPGGRGTPSLSGRCCGPSDG
jgi:hypothetical protein